MDFNSVFSVSSVVKKETYDSRICIFSTEQLRARNFFEGGDYGAQEPESIADQGPEFGWTIASFHIGMNIPSEKQRELRDKGVPPELAIPIAA